jgi:hypothetical protein
MAHRTATFHLSGEFWRSILHGAWYTFRWEERTGRPKPSLTSSDYREDTRLVLAGTVPTEAAGPSPQRMDRVVREVAGVAPHLLDRHITT